MKHSIIVEITGKIMMKTFGLILFFSLSQSEYLFRPNLPMGEYKLVYNKLYHCEPKKNNPIQLNWFISKKTSSITELKGNLTFMRPLDDTLILDINFASWGSTGGWIPNSNIIKSKKAFSSVKYLFGNGWIILAKGFNMTSDSCPVPVGTYITSGVDFKKLEDNNFPKVYFYGKYKISISFKNVENEVVGCTVAEVNLIRPWETPI
ncbi:uncharacterized protein LOC132945508 [Metopolophium dirhodum]|uniref:uncharacterized protein LOC132945508 n=1 Tax=Metopolophium dirhodum TaxID=44670 RepID=UPI00299081E5|nr:uncharacterized protein LOC132945508 [Metopolophium dirhodum]